jgi:outer membrane protein TolC
MASLVLAAAWIVTPATVAAVDVNSGRGASPSIEKLREKTRQSISSFTGDQQGELDNANSLGQVLPSAARAMAKPAVAVSPRSPDRPQAADGDSDDLGLPLLVIPGPQRLLPRPSDKKLMSPLVPTPDFSRQKLTFADLAGHSVIDLPNSQLGDESPIAEGAGGGQVLGLPDLLGLGLDYSPVMDQVQAQLDTALARVRQSRADLLPRLTYRGAWGPETTNTLGADNRHTTSSQLLALTQPVINLPVVYAWMADLSARDAAEWRYGAGRESVSQSITNATINLAASRLVLDYADEQLKEFNQLLDYIQTRAQTGVASQADVERTRTRVLTARQARIDQQAAYHNALLEVERLAGVKPQALKLPYLNQLPGLPLTLGDIRNLVRENNPTLKALRADVESQQRTTFSEYGKMLPALGLSAERDSTENIRGTNAQVNDQRLLAVLTWDISLGGKEFFAGRGASSELTNRQAKLQEETERNLQAVDSDFSMLQSATLRIGQGEAEQRAAAAVVAATREQLKNGRIGSLLEALDAVERLFAARQRLTQVLAQQMQAQAQLLTRIGILSDLSSYSGVKYTQAIPDSSATESTTSLPGNANTKWQPANP